MQPMPVLFRQFPHAVSAPTKVNREEVAKWIGEQRLLYNRDYLCYNAHPDQSQVVSRNDAGIFTYAFVERSHALLFKLVWGGNE